MAAKGGRVVFIQVTQVLYHISHWGTGKVPLRPTLNRISNYHAGILFLRYEMRDALSCLGPAPRHEHSTNFKIAVSHIM